MGKGKARDQDAGAAATDVAILHGPTEDGQGARVLRLKDGTLSAGEVRPCREGEALTGRELISLRPRSDQPAVCDVEVLHDGKQARQPAAPQDDAVTGRGGPARVSNSAYRQGWGKVFAARRRRSSSDTDRTLN